MPENARFGFEAIGTSWYIELHGSHRPADLKRLKAKIAGRIEQFDAAYSRFRSDSLITRISQKAGRYTMPDDAPPLLELYKKLYDLTSGRMTPLIGQTLS